MYMLYDALGGTLHATRLGKEGEGGGTNCLIKWKMGVFTETPSEARKLVAKNAI